MRDVQIVGIDCSAQPKNLAVALAAGGRVTHVEVGLENPAEFIEENRNKSAPLLVAIDAPLGWSVHMGRELYSHEAGEPIDTSRDEMFSRFTDRCIRTRFGIRPMEVGADRIARTAHRAVQLLGDLRQVTGLELPLLLSNHGLSTSGCGTLEVYPAATLKAYGLPHNRYKAKTPAAGKLQSKIMAGLRDRVDFERDTARLLTNTDCLDAVVCVVSAEDYLKGDAEPPPNERIDVHREGWIWVRSRVD